MKTKNKIYIVVLIWAAVFVQLFVNKAFNRESILVEEVMSDGVVNVTAAEVKAYANYGDEKLSDSAKEQIVKNLGKKLGITSDYVIEKDAQENNSSVVFRKKGENGDTNIRLITMGETSASGDTFWENYLMMEISLKGKSASEVYTYKEVLDDLYEDLGMEASTNIYLCSQEKGVLTEEEMQQMVDEFLDTMDAKRVKDIELDQTYCVYGYSKEIDEYVYQNEDKVNVNIAFHYDEAEDITYVHRAVPFIDKSF